MSLSPVFFKVAGTTKPFNFKWLVVVVMVGLNFLASAQAFGFNQLPALQINVGVRPAIHFLSGERRDGIFFPPLAHVTGVASETIAPRLSARFSAFAKSAFHSHIIFHVEHFGNRK